MSITAEMMVQESQLFVALLHRAPDGTNFALYAYDLESGRTVTDVAQRMLDEFGPFYYPSSMTNADIAAQFYLNVHGRAADAQASEFWTARLDAPGVTPAEVIVEMIGSLVNYGGNDPAMLSSQALFNNLVTVSMYYAEYGGNGEGVSVVLEGVTSDPASVDASIEAMRGHWNIPENAGPAPAPPPAPAPAPEPPPPAPAPEPPPPAPAPAPEPPPPPPPPAPDPVVKHGLPDHASELASLYLAYFGRPADWNGLDYYSSQPDFDIWSFTTGFSASPEAQALYGPTFGAEQVNAIYQNLFNRDAEAGGIEYWTGEVGAGRLTAAGAALGILLGAQNDDKVAVQHKLDLATTFVAHVDRQSEVAGYNGMAATAEARAFLHTVDATAQSLEAALAQLDAKIAAVVALGPQPAQQAEVVGVAPPPEA